MKEFKGTTTQWQSEGRTLYSLQDSDHPRLDKENRFSAGFYAHKGCSEEEVIANINLCVAAPDLLEALQNLITDYDNFREKQGRQDSPQNTMMLSARAAIAKALGETK